MGNTIDLFGYDSSHRPQPPQTPKVVDLRRPALADSTI